jgi:hypothetical protein
MFDDVMITPGPCVSGAGHATAGAAGAVVVVVVGAAVVSGDGTLVDVDEGPDDAPAIVDGSSLEHATSASSATTASTPLAELRSRTV